MSLVNDVLTYVQDESHRRLLGWFGAGLVPLATGVWAIIKFNVQSKRQSKAAAEANAELNALVRKLLDDKSRSDAQQRSELVGVITMLNQRLSVPAPPAPHPAAAEPTPANPPLEELAGQVRELLARVKSQTQQTLPGSGSSTEPLRPVASRPRDPHLVSQIATAINNYGAPAVGIATSRWRTLGRIALLCFAGLFGIGVVEGVVQAINEGPSTRQPVISDRGRGGACVDAAFEFAANNTTPTFLTGGRVIGTCEVERLAASPNGTMLIDVLPNAHPTIPSAYHVPLTNQYAFAAQLQQVTGGDRGRPLVFFCHGPDCSYSFQAAEIAISNGYTQVMWYRGGLSAWQQAGQGLQ